MGHGVQTPEDRRTSSDLSAELSSGRSEVGKRQRERRSGSPLGSEAWQVVRWPEGTLAWDRAVDRVQRRPWG